MPLPKICEPLYLPNQATIAVMNFTNNSTFGKADVYASTTTKQGSVIAGIIVNNQGAGVGVGANGSKKNHQYKT